MRITKTKPRRLKITRRCCIFFYFMSFVLLLTIWQCSFDLRGMKRALPAEFQSTAVHVPLSESTITSEAITDEEKNVEIDASTVNAVNEAESEDENEGADAVITDKEIAHDLTNDNSETSVSTVVPNSINATRLCQQTFFWGGGKAGSTSLFITLVRGPGGIKNPEDHGPFFAKGKEPCPNSVEWSSWFKMTQDTEICSQNISGESTAVGMPYTHIVNGCPRVTTEKYAKSIMKLVNDSAESPTPMAPPTFLFLVRDPVDRLTSFLNDEVRRGGGLKKSIEETAARAAQRSPIQVKLKDLFYQGKALQNLLSVVDKEKILVIPIESMSISSQGVVDAVMDHVGGERWSLTNHTSKMKMNIGSDPESAYKYVTLSNETTQALRDKLRDDVILLERLVGKRFSWSSWARSDNAEVDETGGDDTNWLTTNPI